MRTEDFERLRDDIKYAGYALFKGFDVSKGDNNGDAFTFTRGEIVIWSVHGGWMRAKLRDGKYIEHSRFDGLYSAIECED